MLVLDDRSIFQYLVREKILLEEERSQYRVLPLDGKNFSLAVRSDQAKSLIVKQASISDQNAVPFLGEYLLTQLVQKFDRLQPLQASTVMLQHYDIDNKIIVAPFLADYQDLDDYYHTHPQFMPAIAEQVGQTLAQFHRLTYEQTGYRDFLAAADADLVDPAIPSHWDLLPPIVPEDLGQMRQDAFQFFRLYQQDCALLQAIAQLESHWQACCLTHQDLRLNNWLIPRAIDPLSSSRDQPVRLIDWESLQWGDPIADLGNLCAEYLACWLESLNPQPGLPLALVLQQAIIPLETIQPSLQTLLHTYVAEFPVIKTLYQSWRNVLMQFIGRALLTKIQVQLEYYEPFDRQQRIILQIAKQLLCQPENAFAEIFALDRGI